ncbi:MAG: ABC transporter substrate-binding protein [bacterium]|nr:ABC transporter substrate-binding protein [bacterium]
MHHVIRSIAAVLSGVLIAGLLPLLAQAGPAPVVVGVVMPLTGNLAAFGKTSAAGVELAADDINAHGGLSGLGGAKIKLVIRDSTSEAAGAANATARLIDDVHPIAIIGTYASFLSLTSSSVAERRGIPFLTMSFTDDLTNRGYKDTFQVVPKASAIGAKQIEYVLDIAKHAGKQVKKIAIVYENTAFGTSQAAGLKKEAERLGVDVALYDAYPHGLTDATPLVQKITASGAQVVFPESYFTDTVLIVRALNQSHAKVQIAGGAGGFVVPAFKQALGPLADGIMSIDTSSYDAYGGFEQRYQAKYHTFAPHEAYENAVSLYAIRGAIDESRATTPAALRDALAKLDVKGGPFAGLPSDGVKFDATGLNALAYPVMVQWQKGEMVTIWPPGPGRAAPAWVGASAK